MTTGKKVLIGCAIALGVFVVGSVAIVCYSVKQNGPWKILNFQLKPTGPEMKGQETTTEQTTKTAEQTTASTTIVDIKLNEKVGKDGYVDVHKAEYTAQTPEIQTSAYIKNAKKGDDVQAILIYTKTGDQVGPATNMVEHEGDIISNFSFTKPTKGWPVGDYQVAVKVASGEIKAVDFTVK